MLDTANSKFPGGNLSKAWADAFVRCYETPGGELKQALVRIHQASSLSAIETPAIRCLIDEDLHPRGKFLPGQSVVETVASTIFPASMWKRCKGDRKALYDRYNRALPLIHRCSLNRRGLYFERLIAFRGDGDARINQLEHVIQTWLSGNHRRSALQAGIFDPRTDHSNAPRQGFPCLQQIVFSPEGVNGAGGLSVVAFYASQTLLEKAYGNYLGLWRLGQFMAGEMGLVLKDIVCITSTLMLSGSVGKGGCKSLHDALREALTNGDD